MSEIGFNNRFATICNVDLLNLVVTDCYNFLSVSDRPGGVFDDGPSSFLEFSFMPYLFP